MPRTRLGVVLLLPEPLDREADGLRRAFGDPGLTAIAPHITLVSPVNVRHDELGDALAVVRSAAARARPLELALGPVRAFPTDEHVAYLAVDGAGEAGAVALDRLRADLSRPPLERPSEHDFVPHVTVALGVDAARLQAVVVAGRSFAAVVRIDRVHLLQEQQDERGRRRWVPIADVGLGPAVIVGRGGLPIELTPGELVDPEVAALLAGATAAGGPAAPDGAQAPGRPATPEGARPLVVAARREGSVVGAAVGWTAGPVARLDRVAVGEGVAHPDEVEPHLRRTWTSAAAERGAS